MDALVEMLKDNHADLVRKVDGGFKEMTAALTTHAREDDKRFAGVELKLQPLVELREGVKWARRSFYGASVLALITEVFHLLSKAKP